MFAFVYGFLRGVTLKSFVVIWQALCDSDIVCNINSGREEGIRTLESLHFTRVPGVLLQPLGHLSKVKHYSQISLTYKAFTLEACSYEIFKESFRIYNKFL